MTQKQRADREFEAGGEPGPQLLPAPGVHPDLAAPSALSVPHQQRPAAVVEVVVAERERFLNAQPATPEHNDHGAQSQAVALVAGRAHYGDDLLDGWRVGGIAQSLVAGRTSGVVAGHGRGRAPPTGGIEQCWDGHGISSQSQNKTEPAALPALAHP
jgi:hypothetical protein